jgi:GNAT superfamily N-acetyltransferase
LKPSALVLDFKPIVALKKTEVKKFDCGNNAMNDYFKKGFAKTNHESDFSPCVCAVEENTSGPILGYFTLSNLSVTKKDYSSKFFSRLPNYPIPVTLIGRLAVSKLHQRKGIGARMLMHVFYTQFRAVKTNNVGSVGVVVDAIDEAAVGFYSKFDFSCIGNEENYPKRMFISNQTFFQVCK